MVRCCPMVLIMTTKPAKPRKAPAKKAAAKKAAPKKAGRPSSYTQAMAYQICARLIEGESLKAICRSEGMPAASTVFVWLEANQEFRTKYVRARELQAELQVDEMTEIADDGTNDWMEKRDSDGNVIGYRENGEALTRSKIRLEQRRWNAEKLLPKKYGTKVQTELSGSVTFDKITREIIEPKK